MKKFIPLIILSFFFHQIVAQITTNYWVVFKDKNASPYSIANPSAYLSERAIARREKQKIRITENDLPVNPSYINELKPFGITVLNKSKWFNAVTITIIDKTKITEIRALPYVKDIIEIKIAPITNGTAKFNPVVAQTPQSVETAVEQRSITGFNYGLSYKQSHQIGIDCMHDMGYRGEGIVIAVLDAGFYKVDSLPAFDSLRVNHQILGTWDFVTGNASVYEDYEHGMNVLSCMGGYLPGQLVGTAPKAKYWLLRTETILSESWQEEINWGVAAEFADSVGADVINSSLGYFTGMTNSSEDHTYADMDGKTTIIAKAATHAARVGMFVTSSAGNAGGSTWYKIVTPADADSILSVGAVDSAGVIASFSSRGPTFDGRIKPNTVATGLGAITACSSGGVCPQNGTSFSSPITAGAVACLWQAHPLKTNMEILQAIEQSASQHNTPDTLLGFGIPNFCAANVLLTGIEENSLDDNVLQVFPNPFNVGFEISVSLKTKQLITIELYDLSGKQILKQGKRLNGSGHTTFNIAENSALSSGLYLLQINTPEKTYYKKVMKN